MATRNASGAASNFDLSAMPAEVIRGRTLYTFSVHHSCATNKWIATINIGDRVVVDEMYHADNPIRRPTCLSFSFESEREAKKFARVYAPPKMESVAAGATSAQCFVCKNVLEKRKSSKCLKYLNCRNCGVPICKSCSVGWAPRMIPKTFTLAESAAHVQVRVCRPCDWLSNAFCIALLKGRLHDAKALFETGNLNMRSTFADINGEAMFPVHCAVMGGNLDVLRWLVDTHDCPLGGRSNAEHQAGVHSILTSRGRSVMDLAMTGRQQKLDILRYFVVEKNMSLASNTKDTKHAMGALEALLRQPNYSPVGIRDGSVEARDLPNHIGPDDYSASQANSSIEDACTLCYEKSMDCVLIPCGHQLCCVDCGHQLKKCPVCKVNCSVLRIFRT